MKTHAPSIERRRLARRALRGLTMLELLVSLTLLAIVLLSVAAVTVESAGTFRSHECTSQLEEKGRRTLDRLVSELATARRGGLMPASPQAPLGTDALDYQRVTGFAAGVPTMSEGRRLEFRYDPGETDDGVDEDNDGLVDEGMLVWIRDPTAPTAQEVVWVHDVAEYLEGETPNGVDDNGNLLSDERGFSIEAQGNTLILRLTLEGLDQDGKRRARTVQTAVTLLD